MDHRFELGYRAAMGTAFGSFINHGRPVSAKGFGLTTPTHHPDTYRYILGWNAAVSDIENGYLMPA